MSQPVPRRRSARALAVAVTCFSIVTALYTAAMTVLRLVVRTTVGLDSAMRSLRHAVKHPADLLRSE